MREWLNKNPMVAGVLAIVVLGAALSVLVMTTMGGRGRLPDPMDVYYMDLQTGDIFIARSDEREPTSPVGNRGARATVYSCESCADEQTLFVGYVERFLSDDEVRGPMPESERYQVSEDGRRWFTEESDQGARITSPPRCEDGSWARPCSPQDLAQ